MEPLPFFEPEHLELRRRVRSWADVHLIAHAGAEPNLEEEAQRLVRRLGNEGS
jgi:hypothetical protein